MQEKLESTLAKLVAIPTVPDDKKACREIMEFVVEQMKPLNLHIHTKLDKAHPWVVATTKKTKKPKLLLAAHLDVIHANNDSQYMLKKEADRLYGRGVWDMKFAAAGYIEFLKTYNHVLPELDLGILFTADEEIGGYQGVADYLRDGWRAGGVLIPDHNDDWKIEEHAKGAHSGRLYAEGRSAHGSRPWEGDNAVEKLVPVLHELQTTYNNEGKDAPSLSVNMVRGGEAVNQIPDEAAAWLDFRALEETEIDEYKELLQRLCEDFDVKFEETFTSPPLRLDKTNPLVEQYMNSLKAVGLPVEFQISYGLSDAHWFARCDIPCIITGPHGENAHGPDEWMDRQSLLTFYKILEEYVPANAK